MYTEKALITPTSEPQGRYAYKVGSCYSHDKLGPIKISPCQWKSIAQEIILKLSRETVVKAHLNGLNLSCRLALSCQYPDHTNMPDHQRLPQVFPQSLYTTKGVTEITFVPNLPSPEKSLFGSRRDLRYLYLFFEWGVARRYALVLYKTIVM